MATLALFTRREYDLLPEGFPAQLIAGELVKRPGETYGHGMIGAQVVVSLLPLVGTDRMPLGVDVAIDDSNVYRPDIAVFREPPPWDERATRTPTVVFEVLSPATRSLDAGVKRRGYLRGGVEEVWLVDEETAAIEIHTRAGVVTSVGSQPARSAAIPGFVLVPERLFSFGG